ncbi:hypothetical protein [Hydrogenimonas thermophila]|nr:hypothetical protein [Hydrogenimonas thermophila]WOE69724.1 hypothetical protein RZR91_11525 [Hydrogenimonas thermophila]WOE72238.1 hypothetical protein RZR97_11515 [Hydrogenimonas thermophila]
MIELHIWPVVVLGILIALNIAVIVVQKDDFKLKKYLRIQATAWTTLMSMIVFTGATIMAFYHLNFTIKIIAMIVAFVAMSSLEIRRHLLIKKSRPGQECFANVRKKVLRYYVMQALWMLMIGGFATLT